MAEVREVPCRLKALFARGLCGLPVRGQLPQAEPPSQADFVPGEANEHSCSCVCVFVPLSATQVFALTERKDYPSPSK